VKNPSSPLSSGEATPSVLSRRALLRAGSLISVGAAASQSLRPLRCCFASESWPAHDEVWDTHVHLSGVAGTVPQRIDALLQYADRVGIARLIVFMGTTFIENPTPDELRRQNDDVLQAIAHAPDRILGMVYLNPRQRAASMAELDRCVRDGPMVGIKLWISMKCGDPDLDPLVRRAVELQIPILQHAYDRVGENLPGESTTRDVAILAERHPDAVFVCLHTGNDWERGIRFIRHAKNVYAEISGSDPTAGFVEMAVRELGADRIIYGSDAGGRSFASQLAKVYSADLPDDARRLVLGGNLRRILAPALANKGMKP
jgi:uncharacterized protein